MLDVTYIFLPTFAMACACCSLLSHTFLNG